MVKCKQYVVSRELNCSNRIKKSKDVIKTRTPLLLNVSSPISRSTFPWLDAVKVLLVDDVPASTLP